MSAAMRRPAPPADIFELAAKAVRRMRAHFLARRIRLSSMACQVLLRHIENDMLAMTLYPEYTNALHDQIDASHAELRQELAALVRLDEQLAQVAG